MWFRSLFALIMLCMPPAIVWADEAEEYADEQWLLNRISQCPDSDIRNAMVTDGIKVKPCSGEQISDMQAPPLSTFVLYSLNRPVHQ